MKDKDNNIISIATNIGKEVAFDEITFDLEGTFVYYISEIKGADGNINYDEVYIRQQ